MSRWTDHGQADIYNEYGEHVGRVWWHPDYGSMIAEGIVGFLFAVAVFITIGLIVLLAQLFWHFPKTMIALTIIGFIGFKLWYGAAQAEQHQQQVAAAATAVAVATQTAYDLNQEAPLDLSAMPRLAPAKIA